MTRFSLGQWVLLGILAVFVLPISFAFLEQFSLSEFAEIIHDSHFRLLFLRTLRQAGISTIGCMLIGIPGAWYWAREKTRKKRYIGLVLQVYSVIPFSVPAIIFVFCIILVFGNNGIVNRWLTFRTVPFLYNSWAIIGAHILYNMGIVIRFVGQALRRSVTRYMLVAQSMGASRGKQFSTIALPLLLPSIVHAAGITFLFCFTSFVVVMVLGGGPRDSSLEVLIYETLRFDFDLRRASAIAGFQAIVGITVIAIYTFVLRRQAREPVYQSIDFVKQKPRSGILQHVYGIGLTILLLLPLLALLLRFFEQQAPGAITRLVNIQSLAMSFAKSMGTGLGTAAICALVAMLLCSIGLRTGLFQRVVITGISGIPLCLSPMILVLSLLVLVQRNIHSSVLIIFVHSALSLPFIVPMCMQYLQRIPESLAYAPGNLGASRLREFFTIHLPLSRDVILSCASFGLLISLGEFNAVFYLRAREQIPPLSIYLFRSISRYRFEEGIIASIVLLCAVVVLTGIIERLQRKPQLA